MTPSLREQWRWRAKEVLATTILTAQSITRAADLARARRRPLILGYHRVVEDFGVIARSEMPSMLISRDTFEQHVDALAREFAFVGLDEIGEHLVAGEPFDKPTAAITFDDGYSDVYEHAYPLLARKGIPAAVFVVTDLVERQGWQVHDKLYYLLCKGFSRWDNPRRELLGLMGQIEPSANLLSGRGTTRDAMTTVSTLLPALPQSGVELLSEALESALGNGRLDIPATMTPAMLRTMAESGFTIGSHTRSHVSLPIETPEVIADELEGSKRYLESQLGRPVDHFAYPGGQFTPAVVEAVARAGYRYAYIACAHRDPAQPALTQERLLLWERSAIDANGRFSPPILRCQAHALWPPARRCSRRHRS